MSGESLFFLIGFLLLLSVAIYNAGRIWFWKAATATVIAIEFRSGDETDYKIYTVKYITHSGISVISKVSSNKSFVEAELVEIRYSPTKNQKLIIPDFLMQVFMPFLISTIPLAVFVEKNWF